MGKKPIKNITTFEKGFGEYFYDHILDTKEEEIFINKLASVTDLYVFGGLIRDFIISKEYEGIRNSDIKYKDVDIVLSSINDDTRKLFDKYLIRENSFGGFKLKINNTRYDIWSLESTWGLKNYPQIPFDEKKTLINSSFFNSTAILYSINDRKFIYDELFSKFYYDMVLDIVFEVNPYPELCIIKALEYSISYKKLNLRISEKLRDYIVRNFESSKYKFEETQINNYGTIKFDYNEINDFYYNLDEIIDGGMKKNVKQLNKSTEKTNAIKSYKHIDSLSKKSFYKTYLGNIRKRIAKVNGPLF